MKYLLVFLCILHAVLLPNSTIAQIPKDPDIAALEQSSKAIRSIIQKTQAAVVHIFVEKTNGSSTDDLTIETSNLFNDPFFDDFFGSTFRKGGEQQQVRGHGSGFLFNPEGYILTNNHVIQDADKILVQLLNNKKFDATIVGVDPLADLALIKIDGTNLPTLPLGDSDQIEVGDWAIAVGFPFIRNQTSTMGIICALGLNDIGINEFENYIQTDAAMNPGNSGGPLLNIYGQAVGMNTAFSSPVSGGNGVGFAIPINMVKAIGQQLLENGKVTRGWLGVVIENLDDETMDPTISGIVITNVKNNSPAAQSGLKEGDIIYTMNGNSIKDAAEFRNRITLTPPQQVVTIQLLRGKKKMERELTLGLKN